MAPLAGEPNDDRALVQRVQEGDTRAFEQLVCQYQDRVVNLCYRMVNHHETARDLAQDTFLRAFESLAGFEHKSSFYTWLFRIAVNLCISYRRKNRRIKLHSLGTDADATAGDHQASDVLRLRGYHGGESAGNPVEALQRKETQQAVADALDSMEDDFKIILILRDIESRDYETIAGVLEIPIGTVRSRLHRARLALREKLKPVLEKAG